MDLKQIRNRIACFSFEVYIENGDIKKLFRDGCKRRFNPGRDFNDMTSKFVKQVLEQHGDHRLVLDDEDATALQRWMLVFAGHPRVTCSRWHEPAQR